MLRCLFMMCFGKKITSFLFALSFIVTLQAQSTPNEIRSFKKDSQSVLFNCANGEKARLSLVADDIIRVEISSKGQFKKSKMIELGYVKDDFQKTNYNIVEQKEYFKVSTSLLTILVNKANFGIKVLDKNNNLIVQNNTELGIQTGAKNVLNFDMPADEHFFGFGFMRKTLDARGHKLTFKRAYRWKEATLPFFMSTRGYAFYSNNIYNQDFDFTSKSDAGLKDYYTVVSNGGVVDFYIIYGPDFPRILERYTDLTGKSMMVPKWAFGLQYRLRYYGNQEELLSIAKEFRKKEIPADIMALEPGWEDVAYSMDWRWSPKRFPEPKKMIKQLDSIGFKLDLWESGVAPTKNITSNRVRKKWYAKRKPIVDMGVKMFKQDDPYPRSILSSELLGPVLANNKLNDQSLSGEELNNVANTLYSETLFNEFRKQTNERAVVMFHAYNASVASHRWPFQWAGDFQAENGMLNASLSGHAMVSYDIRNPYAAGWHQGFFTPFSVVDAWAYYREPWLYSESIEESHRLYACLRSRLVPYLYATLWQSHKTGLPIERPMVLNYHDDPVTHQMKSQFMVGDWFLLALSDVDDSPSGEKIDFWTGSQKGNYGRAYLPKGKWINYWNGEEQNIQKAQWIKGEWPEYLGGLLFVKAGAIIPMGQVKNYVGEKPDEVVVLDIYPHKTSSYQLYEDDGTTYGYEKGAYAITYIKSKKTGSNIKINISARKGKYDKMSEKRTFLVKMHTMIIPKSIVVDGNQLQFFSDAKSLVNDYTENGWYYDEKNRKAIIKLDKGWRYAINHEDKDPLGTIPLTSKNEKIEWRQGIKIEEANRQIVVELPQLAVPYFTSNMAGLPADGYSLAKVNIDFKNTNDFNNQVNLKIEGEATFLNNEKEMSIGALEKKSFLLKSGSIPGVAKVIVSGLKIETSVFELPIYGNPTTLEIASENSVLLADGSSSLKLSARLYDLNKYEVLTSGVPIIIELEGEALNENGLTKDSVYLKNGKANFKVQSSTKPGKIKIASSYRNLKGETLEVSSEKGEMQVRINPPEKVKLDSDGGWIPDKVDVFVNFKVGGKVARSKTSTVTLNVYNKQKELLDTYVQKAKKGEVIFKDITYYRRPAQCWFEIKSEGYEDVKRKVFANTWDWDLDYLKKKKKKKNH